MNPLPILAQNTQGVVIVEVAGQPVVTSKSVAEALEYKAEKAIQMLFSRNRSAFRDAGLIDLTRGSQTVTPFPKKMDTAMVRIMTPSATDGRGGGPQDVRVYTKRGALKICMKSNQPKAIDVQDMLIDLYEKIEAGQLVGAERFGRVMKTLMGEITLLNNEISHLKERPSMNINLPDDSALPIAVERRRGHSRPFSGGLRDPEVREYALMRRRQGAYYSEIVQEIKERWPNEPDKHVSRSALQRFWAKATRGHLKEFGIDVTVN